MGGQKRSTVLVAAIIAEGIVNNIRDCKTHYVNEKRGGPPEERAAPLSLAVTFLLAWLKQRRGVAGPVLLSDRVWPEVA